MFPRFLAFICLVITAVINGQQGHNAKLKDIMDRYWNWKMRAYPQTATSRGVHDYDTELDQYTMEQFKDNKDTCEGFLSELVDIEEAKLSFQDADNYEVLKEELTQYVRGYEWRNFGNLNPINFMEGIHRASRPTDMRFRNEPDFDIYATRMSKFPTQIDQVIELMREAIRLRRTNHNVSMAAVPEQISVVIVPANKSSWYWPYAEMLPNISLPDNKKEEIRSRGENIIENNIIPAYRKLQEFIQNEYMNHTREHHGVWSWEFGRQFYQECLRFYLNFDITATEVRDLGRQELARIKGLMEQIMQENRFQGSLPEFFAHLRTYKRKEYYDKTAEWLFQEYKDITYNRINPKLNMIVRNVPNVPIRVSPMPYDGPPGLYGSDTYWVNLRKPETRPTFTMMALSLHEANPGHHMQTAYARNVSNPTFRRYGGVGRYYSAPFNFPWYTAYSEGWGLYAEHLGEVMGVYNRSALELFGRYSWEIIRACRLVVDTGMHAFGMTREEAIELIANHSAMPPYQIALEVERYITWPGQACAYKMGEMEFIKWKNDAKAQLGSRFDIRDYNEAILSTGRAPLTVAQKAVQLYIDANKPPASAADHLTIQSVIILLSYIFCVL